MLGVAGNQLQNTRDTTVGCSYGAMFVRVGTRGDIGTLKKEKIHTWGSRSVLSPCCPAIACFKPCYLSKLYRDGQNCGGNVGVLECQSMKCFHTGVKTWLQL